MREIIGVILLALLPIVFLAFSWAFVNFVVWLIFLCLGWEFNFLIGTAVWLVAMLLRWIFSAARNN